MDICCRRTLQVMPWAVKRGSKKIPLSVKAELLRRSCWLVQLSIFCQILEKILHCIFILKNADYIFKKGTNAQGEQNMDTGEELQSATATNRKKKENIYLGFFSFDFYPLGRKVRQCPPIPPSSSPPFLSPPETVRICQY